MMRRRTRDAGPIPRPSRHGRHGRVGRSPVVRPPLPPLETRIDAFDLTVGTAAEFLRGAWDDLRDVSFEIGDMPPAPDADGIPRWQVLPAEKRIIVYRIPVERLGRQQRNDDTHRRIVIEGTVFRAAAEYLGRDPWDLGPERFRF